MFEITQKIDEGWIYNDCSLVRAVDGDTLVLKLRGVYKVKIDFGFHIKDTMTLEKEGVFYFRLAEVNTPEMRGSEKAAGQKAKEAVQKILDGAAMRVISLGEGKYGRWIGKIYVTPEGGEELYLSGWLIEEGYGKPYKPR